MDISTTLRTLFDRAAESIMDSIATDGLIALRKVLDESGFSDSEYLKNYEVYAHVKSKVVVFEIVLDIESIELDEELPTAEELETKLKEEEEEEEEEIPGKTFTLSRSTGKVSRMVDIRRPAIDARRKSRDTKKISSDRSFDRRASLKSPRGANITKSGKLKISTKRKIKKTEEGIKYPKGGYDGIVGDFIKELIIVIQKKFAPELSRIISRTMT